MGVSAAAIRSSGELRSTQALALLYFQDLELSSTASDGKRVSAAFTSPRNLGCNIFSASPNNHGPFGWEMTAAARCVHHIKRGTNSLVTAASSSEWSEELPRGRAAHLVASLLGFCNAFHNAVCIGHIPQVEYIAQVRAFGSEIRELHHLHSTQHSDCIWKVRLDDGLGRHIVSHIQLRLPLLKQPKQPYQSFLGRSSTRDAPRSQGR